jgi:hypothetical protein
MIRIFLTTALLLAFATSVYAAPAIHINIQAADGAKQTVRINQPLPQHFVARITRDDGRPVSGIRVAFAVNACMTFSGGSAPACPDASLYGRFDGDPNAMVSNAQGNAESPRFIAGKLGGTYTVFASQIGFAQEIDGQTFSSMPPSASASNLFSITQLSAAPDSVPALNRWALLLLVAGIGLASLVHGRARKTG